MMQFSKYFGLIVLVLATATVALTPAVRSPDPIERAKWEFSPGTDQQPLGPHVSVDSRPNFIIIMADDLGYTDIGAFGGEIPTPNIDELARNGVKMTNFYTASTCAPTRAMLMTGHFPHAAGVGSALPSLRFPWQAANPSYQGELNGNAITIAEILRSAGYDTFMAGKWHLGSSPESDPHARGFDRSYSLIDGAASHFDDSRGVIVFKKEATYRENGAEFSVPENFYSTNAYTEKVISFIEQRSDQTSPFFAYLAYTAPHWPLQAPKAWVTKFKGVYDQGYGHILEARIRKATELGVAAKGTPKHDIVSELNQHWNNLGPNDRASSARKMEVYAAMVAKVDEQVGNLVRYLEKSGKLDNTLILFLSDNGADSSYAEALRPNRGWVKKSFDNSLSNIGQKGSYVSYGPKWADVGSGPLAYFKGISTEGGIKSPAIMFWPKKIKKRTADNRFMTIMDILPTFSELAGATIPEKRNGVTLIKPYGESIAHILTQDDGSEFHDPDYPVIWESAGSRAVRRNNWKLVYVPELVGDGNWSLFNLEQDPNESRDVSENYPKKLNELISLWKSYDAAYVVETPPKFLLRMLFKSEPDSLDIKN